jgi:AraC-like DNA-binding protein
MSQRKHSADAIRQLPRITQTGFIDAWSGGVQLHSHVEECEFHYFTHAQACFDNGTTSIKVGNGSLVYSWPQVAHRCRSYTRPCSLRFYFVRFIADKATRALLEANEERLPLSAAAPLGLSHAVYFEQIRRRAQEHSSHAQAAACHLLLSLIHELAATDASSILVHPAVDRAIGFMREHVQDALTLDACANAAGVGKPYLIRLFRQHVGVPPMHYHLRLKMETARYLLDTTGEPVREIAGRLAFWDEFHFSRTFKKLTGLSPSEYRRRRRSPLTERDID